MKTRWAGVALLVALSALGAPGTAAAHSSSITATCATGRTTLSVQITNYTGENQVLVSDDGATVAGTSFGPEFRLRRDFDGSVDHSFSFMVRASDDPSGAQGWSFVKKVDVARCATAAPPAVQAKPVAPQATTVPLTTTTAVTTASAPASSASVPSSTEAGSVLAGREVPLPSPNGISLLWTVLACLVLLGSGVATFVIVRRKKLRTDARA